MNKRYKFLHILNFFQGKNVKLINLLNSNNNNNNDNNNNNNNNNNDFISAFPQ